MQGTALPYALDSHAKIIGGHTGSAILAQTLYGISHHAMINMNDGRTMVIGGYSKVDVHTFSS